MTNQLPMPRSRQVANNSPRARSVKIEKKKARIFFAELFIPKATLRAAPHRPESLGALHGSGRGGDAGSSQAGAGPGPPGVFGELHVRHSLGRDRPGTRHGPSREPHWGWRCCSCGCSQRRRAPRFQKDLCCWLRVSWVYQSAFYTGENKAGLFGSVLLTPTGSERETLQLMS